MLVRERGVKNMRVLITGGAGRLGIIVCRMFSNDGMDVRVFDLDTARNRKSVKELNGRVEVSWGDITQPDSVRQALEGVDAVVHMAAILPPLADEQAELARKVNVGGTRVVVDILKENGNRVPFVFTSSAAVFGPTPDAKDPLCPDKTQCHPKGAYAKTKLEAESIIKEAGIDYLVLRLTATPYFVFALSDIKRMFTIPLDQRIEYCHPNDTARAILNSVKSFNDVKGDTLVISGGTEQRMLYRDMIGAILKVIGLPLPPARKFAKATYCLDWYDTTKAQQLLRFQKHTFSDYLRDFANEISRRYGSTFLPFMKQFAGPLFGRLVVQLF